MTKPRGRCPQCGYVFDDATDINDEKAVPKDGDISICINCGCVNQFDKLGVKEIDISTLDKTTRDEVERIKKAWSKMKQNESHMRDKYAS